MAKQEYNKSQNVRVVPPMTSAGTVTPVDTPAIEVFSDLAQLDELEEKFEPLPLSIEILRGDVIYNEALEGLAAAGRVNFPVASITDGIQYDWNSLTPEEQQVLSIRLKHVAAVAQAVAATVDEYMMYSRAR